MTSETCPHWFQRLLTESRHWTCRFCGATKPCAATDEYATNPAPCQKEERMTSEQARRIAQEVADGIFGAGASETQRLGALAVSTINRLADELDAFQSAPAPPAPEPKARARPAQAHDRKAAKQT